MSHMEFIKSTRSGVILCVNNFMFKRKIIKKGIEYYYCVSKCKSSVQAINGEVQIPTLNENHDHPSHEEEIAKLKCVQKLRKRAAEEPLTSIHKLYRSERQAVRNSMGMQAAADLPSFTSLESTLYRERNSRFPGFPKTLAQLQLSGIWSCTLDNKPFVLADDGCENKILIFGTVDFLEIACNSDRLVLDGTFKVVPSIFQQLYIFHAKYLGQAFPLLYCFLTSKSKICYIRMLELIKAKALECGFVWNDDKIFNVDFESSAIAALNHTFPSSEVKGCLFHFGQCLWRKVQSLGFSAEYTAHKEVQRWVRLAASLALVPIDRVDEAYLLVDANSPTQLSSHQIESFHDYLVEVWVDDLEAKFPRKIWNHFATDKARTTNAAESFHSKLNRMAAKSHLNIYAMIDLMKEIQADNETEIERLKDGGRPKLPPLNSRKLEEKIINLKNLLNTGAISLLEYMDSVSRTFHMEN